MKNIGVHELLTRLRSYFLESHISRKFVSDEPPLRAELFNTEQLEQHGRHLAQSHKVATGKTTDKLLKQLARNEKILIEVRDLLVEAIRENRLMTPAGEWLLDNFYLIEDNIHTGKKHLPKGYSESLPYLINTPTTGLPRVYDIALEIISHSDGRISLENLEVFIKAYQAESTLMIGELWAIPIMLRLALIENLKRIAARVAVDRVNQNIAGAWATQMIETAEKDPKSLILVIADMARSGPPMESSFVAELIRQLMWKGSSLSLPITWMEQRLSEMGLTRNELVDLENQKQAADQVSIANSLGSLRSLGSIEWKEFVESMSVVENTLRQEKAGVYAKMDFTTRDHYRHVIEKISKYSSYTENEVAAIIVNLANEHAGENKTDDREAHIGYYLISEGRKLTNEKIRQTLPLYTRLLKNIKQHPFFYYAGSIILLTSLISFAMVTGGYYHDMNIWLLVFTSVMSFIAASYLATALVNWWSTLMFSPDLLPRMDFANGIPKEAATMVVVPTMLMNKNQADSLVEALEVRFLANRDNNLYFALLTDFPDAKSETLETDEPILKFITKRINELNRKYSADQDKFFLFHRPRKWNNHDKIWMGYERKRGKLSELNSLLRGHPNDYFSLIAGNIGTLPSINYVITLDTDTQFPHDAGWKLVASMAHPLNHPIYDERKSRITKGYGILQPRISISLSRAGNSLYSLIHSNEPGIDPYTRLTSDVYQDLFEEGSFIGKGIYHIDSFELALNGRFPENRILSHDLLEGCYARAGLLTDVQLYEEYPMQYSADVNRRHRWIRGDWQIGYWSLPIAPDANRKLRKNPISALSKWKILDNLRRSLVPFAFTSLLFFGWLLMHDPSFWTISVVLLIFFPPIIASIWNVFHKSNDVTLKQHLVASIASMRDHFLRTGFMFICLPYETYYSLDAIARTGWRMVVSRKKLLEWNPASNQEHTSDKTLIRAYRSMWFSPFFSLATIVVLAIFTPFTLMDAMPLLLLWMSAPFLAWWISKPLQKDKSELTGSQIVYLRHIARKTWAFFERFVGEEDNWLPPDNYQEHPGNVIAHRTSPTNIGLSLLANLTAYDFGYIPVGVLLQRSQNTFTTLQKLERYEGHLYNWYDTISLRPLPPKYVSTVDSGNMAGHLLTFRQGLLALVKDKIDLLRLFDGLKDTIAIITRELPENISLQQFRTNVWHALESDYLTPSKAKQFSDLAMKYATEIVEGLRNEKPSEGLWWAELLLKQCTDIHNEISFLFPWVTLPAAPTDAAADLLNRAILSSLHQMASLDTRLLPDVQDYREQAGAPVEWLDLFAEKIKETVNNAQSRIEWIGYLEKQCTEFADINYEFLYDKSKHLLAIGYNIDEHRRDASFYDLLASESSLTTFIAIAQGKIPQESWFSLGRLLSYSGGEPLLLSWSGSMFEYLMPLLVMPEYEGTLLHQTFKNIVSKQIKFGDDNNIPWGISESGYNVVDANLNYQYRAFGVPGTGLKRGLGEDIVVAPYASALALMVDPDAACRNMQHLSAEGIEGRYGLYEAIDYTPSRLPRGKSRAVIQSFMAHHQGMSFLAMAYALLDQPMQKRFEADLQFRSAMLLLQERIPNAVTFYTYSAEAEIVGSAAEDTEIRVITTPHTPVPEVQLLSNGKYHVMVTNAGGGYSKWKDLAVTRWREDTTCDNWGTFCYIRDVEDGNYWSNTYQPTLKMPKTYDVTFAQGRVDFRRRDGHIDTHTEIVVSSEDNIEMRRIHITNHSRKRKVLDVTSYTEIVLSSPIADVMHPAFSNLFVQTEIIGQRNAIIATRRPRSSKDVHPFLFHLVTVHGATSEEVSYETDRMKFIGRGNSIVTPKVMTDEGPLSNSEGFVLDPIASVRHKVVLEPEETVIVDIITGICDTREGCLSLIDKYIEKPHKDRVFELAWTHSQVVLRQINATEADAQLYSQLASSVLFSTSALRADASILMKNRRGQSGLWGYSISGDLPIVLLKIEDQANIELVKQMVQAHTYWRLKGLAVDLVIWNEDHGGYRQSLQNQVLGLITAGGGAELTDHPGGIYVRAADQISEEDNILFQSVARVCIWDKKGTLTEQLNRKNITKPAAPVFIASQTHTPSSTAVSLRDDLLLFNGIGGFTPDQREYNMLLSHDNNTPLPWVNVLANPDFGTVISESGQSYTWIENAHEFRLTPWENDPICDKGGEVFYLRNEETGHFWSATSLPVPSSAPYVTRHGMGYSVFEHMEDGIHSEMTVFVDIEAPVKFFVIKLKNTTAQRRHLSLTGYIEWVLGDIKSKTAMHVITETDSDTGAIIARNNYNTEFTDRIAFFDTDETIKTITCDRAEFIGRNGTLSNPAAMYNTKLSGKTGVLTDSCTAIQTGFILSEGQEKTVIFRLGASIGIDNVRNIIKQFKGKQAATQILEKTQQYWFGITNITKITTPDTAFNILANGWLLYQTIVCRLWARSGYYQSGGAYGFRDQLQDVLAIMYVQPALARKQILLCASRQFREGDVQHWWHPPTGRGVRTRCSDDMLWLPFVTYSYVVKTGDYSILDEQIPFLEGRMLNHGEESYYDLPARSDESASLYEHCLRSIKHSLVFGEHGLPLIGSGDWNDGMDMVGREGKGESVWLAFFLYNILDQFATIAKTRNDQSFAELCLNQAKDLQRNIEENAWDGGWYRRAYFDDGTPLGSASNDECQIDSISQSWAILSGAGDNTRVRQAIEAADKRLVNPEKMLIQLLDPPFNVSALNPGYIKGYVPGIRENGGQYTHAAIWLIMAHAALGNAGRAWELMNMVNPINHALSAELVNLYKVEPYVMAADIYSIEENSGRGGWTWYTGSAGWMFQLIFERLLGFRLQGDVLSIAPCLNPAWHSYKISYQFHDTTYHIIITQNNAAGAKTTIILDGTKHNEDHIRLQNDGAEHTVEISISPNLQQINTNATFIKAS